MGTIPLKVIFVCLGNLCRSPLAQAFFRRLVKDAGLEKRIMVESRGLSAALEGRAYHPFAHALCAARGLALEGHSLPLGIDDIREADYVLVVDEQVLREVVEMLPFDHFGEKVRVLRVFGSELFAGEPMDIPDPIGQPPEAMEEAFVLIEDACRGLFAAIREREGL